MTTIVLLGDAGVGKTNFIYKYLSDQQFEERYLPTLGVDKYTICFPNGHEAEIRDTAGNKHFLVNRHSVMYANIDFAIIMFDLTVKKTWQNVESYIEKLPLSCLIWLCGNKLDDKRNRKISSFTLNREYLLLKMEHKNVIGLVEMSIKNDINVSLPLKKIGNLL